MTTDDHRDLEAARQGDLDAMERLVKRYYKRVRAVLAFSGLRGAEDIEDGLQETFIRAFENLASMKGPRFRSWLYGIARNVALETLREKRLPAAGEMVESIAEPVDVGSTPEEWLNALEHCQEKLPEDAKALLEKIYGAGMKLHEAAEFIGKSVGAVKVSVFRLRETLRRCIEGHLGGAPWTAVVKR